MISAAAFISNRPMIDGPVMLSSTPRAPSIADSSNGLEMAALAADTARSSPLAWPMPIRAEPALDSTILTSAKSVLIRPGVVIRPVMPDTPCSSTSSAILNALSTLVLSLATVSRRSFGMTISVSTFSFRRCTPLSACTARRRPSKENGRVTTPIVSAPGLAGDLGDDRSGAGAGAAALAGGDEHHVGAADHLFDLVVVRFGGRAADLGVAAGAEAPREVAADVELDVGVAHQQRLGVGVDGDELDALQAGVDHAVHGVDAAAADADDLDDGKIVLRSADHQRILHWFEFMGSNRSSFGSMFQCPSKRTGAHPARSETCRTGTLTVPCMSQAP